MLKLTEVTIVVQDVTSIAEAYMAMTITANVFNPFQAGPMWPVNIEFEYF